MDPLHRSRWNDRLRPRWLFQLLGLLIIAGIAAALVMRYWPEPDERDLAADQEIATLGALELDDVPDAWKSTADAGLVTPLDPLIKFVEDGFTPCRHFEDLTKLADEPGEQRAFASGDNLISATNRVLVAETSEQATDFLDALRDDDTGDCFAALVERELVSDPENSLDNLRVTQLDPPVFGDEAAWYRVEGTITGGLFPVDITMDMVTIRVDRTIAEFSFFGQFERVGVAVQRDAVRPVSQRLADLLAPESETE